jgi:hypothetical protein
MSLLGPYIRPQAVGTYPLSDCGGRVIQQEFVATSVDQVGDNPDVGHKQETHRDSGWRQPDNGWPLKATQLVHHKIRRSIQPQ